MFPVFASEANVIEMQWKPKRHFHKIVFQMAEVAVPRELVRAITGTI
jgi:hypothetical protein